jgi:hypothetical protein
MNEYTKKYLDIIFNQMTEAVDLKNIEKNKEVGHVIFNNLFNLDGPKKVKRDPSVSSIFIANLFFEPFLEILNSVEAIENISVFVKSFPYKKQNISRVHYLKYHIENYLNELYILKNRLITYLKIIERAYKKSDHYSHIEKTLKPFYNFISNSFEGFIETKGIHVHMNRFFDDDISRLSSLELLSRGDSKPEIFIKNHYIFTYRQIRKKWMKKIKDDMYTINNLLNQYFKELILAICEEDKIIDPSQIK